GCERIHLAYEGLAQRRGTTVVAHVAPQEELFAKAFLHASVETAEDVGEGRQLLLGNRLQRELQLVEHYSELAQHSAGEAVDQIVDISHDGADGGVPAGHEVIPDFLQLNEKAQEICQLRVGLLQDDEQWLPIILF